MNVSTVYDMSSEVPSPGWHILAELFQFPYAYTATKIAKFISDRLNDSSVEIESINNVIFPSAEWRVWP